LKIERDLGQSGRTASVDQTDARNGPELEAIETLLCKCYLGSLRLPVPTLCGIYDAENRGGCVPWEDRRNEEMRFALNRGNLRLGDTTNITDTPFRTGLPR
jgi:hypothetical protein